jgi:hypothetical protein
MPYDKILDTPLLQSLTVVDSRGLGDLTINSVSLLEMELRNLDGLWHAGQCCGAGAHGAN